MGGGGGGDSGRKGPQRLEPLASFAKHVGASSALQPWEGAPVLLDGSVPYRCAFKPCGPHPYITVSPWVDVEHFWLVLNLGE